MLKRPLIFAKKCIMSTWVRSQMPSLNMWVQLLQPHKKEIARLMIKWINAKKNKHTPEKSMLIEFSSINADQLINLQDSKINI